MDEKELFFSRADRPNRRRADAARHAGQLGWLAEIQTRFVPCLATDHKPRSLSPSRRFRGKKAAPTVEISNARPRSSGVSATSAARPRATTPGAAPASVRSLEPRSFRTDTSPFLCEDGSALSRRQSRG